jgi:hypothetical protein
MKTKLAFVFMALLFACASESPTPITDLSGKWSVSSVTVNGKLNLTRRPAIDIISYLLLFDKAYDFKITYSSKDYFITQGTCTTSGSTAAISIYGDGFFFRNGVISKDLKTIEFGGYMAPKEVPVVEKVVFKRL